MLLSAFKLKVSFGYSGNLKIKPQPCLAVPATARFKPPTTLSDSLSEHKSASHSLPPRNDLAEIRAFHQFRFRARQRNRLFTAMVVKCAYAKMLQGQEFFSHWNFNISNYSAHDYGQRVLDTQNIAQRVRHYKKYAIWVRADYAYLVGELYTL